MDLFEAGLLSFATDLPNKECYGPRPLVLRSGGADSTYLMYRLLLAGIPFDWVYVELPNNHRKVKAELLAIELQDVKFKEMFPDTFPEVSRNIITVNTSISNNRYIRSSQVATWMMGVMSVLSPKRHSHVLMAMIASDQGSIYIHEIQQAWKNLVAITLVGCNKIAFEFPTKLMSKSDVISSLPEELYQLTWSCELPKVSTFNLDTCESACMACDTRTMVETSLAKTRLFKPWDISQIKNRYMEQLDPMTIEAIPDPIEDTIKCH